MKDTHWRSIVKAFTWRAIATLTTMGIVYGFTREVTLSLGVGALDVVLKLLFYYFHERAWTNIMWGKNK